MTDPSLRSASVVLKFESSTGYKCETKFSSGVSPKPATAIQALCAAVEEIARIAEIAGEGAQIEESVAAAVRRVKEWRANKAEAPA